jgi:hypothetical protein
MGQAALDCPGGGRLIDYSKTGRTIQQAMIDSVSKSNVFTDQPPKLEWGNFFVQTSDIWNIKPEGRVVLEFLQSDPAFEHGVDLSLNGWLQLESQTRIACLRTWRNERYEDRVEYLFHSEDGKLRLWNVYKMGQGEQEISTKWTGNAGFWVETISPNERIYHCSHAKNDPPDFGSLIFKVSILDA